MLSISDRLTNNDKVNLKPLATYYKYHGVNVIENELGVDIEIMLFQI